MSISFINCTHKKNLASITYHTYKHISLRNTFEQKEKNKD